MNKTASLLLIIFCAFVASASAQFQTLTTTSLANVTITIPAGQVMQVFNFTHESTTSYLRLTKDSNSLNVLQSISMEGSTSNIAQQSYFVGPATLQLTGGRVCLSYKLFDNPTVAGTTVPSTAVVIPADASGPVNIILESSTDLLTWTPASPGSYGSSTAKRFFRVRAVSQ